MCCGADDDNGVDGGGGGDNGNDNENDNGNMLSLRCVTALM